MSNEQPHIALICRYHFGRKELFRRAVASLQEQTYTNYTLMVSAETEQEMQEVREVVEGKVNWACIYVKGDRTCGEYFYNLFLNDLKKSVKDSWILVYDSDNYLSLPNSLEKLSKLLTNPDEINVIQFVRKGRPKPSDVQIQNKVIKSGHSDSASITFHGKHNDKGHFLPLDNGDWHFLQQMTSQLKTNYHKLRVVETDRRSRGKN